MRGKAALDMAGVMAGEMTGDATGGMCGVATGVGSEDIDIVDGADIIDGLGIDIGGGATTGPPDTILENAMGSIPGGISIPPILAAAMISAAVGSTVPVM